MSFDAPPPPSDSTLRRQRRVLQIAIVVLLVGAIAIAGFVTQIPLPVRLFVAVTDLIAAAVLWLVLRQKFRL